MLLQKLLMYSSNGLLKISVSLFAGICSVLFENRMGCLNEQVPEETQKFIISVGEMFHLSQIVTLFPKSTWPYLPFWKKFVVAWDHLFKVGEENVSSYTLAVSCASDSVKLSNNGHGQQRSLGLHFMTLFFSIALSYNFKD